MRRAKIVCTLGPATSTERRVRELVYAGMDVARLNMSHGTHEDHAAAYRLVRDASDSIGHGVGIFADLQGPKIRLGRVADGPVQLRRGSRFTITTRDVPGDAEACSTTYAGLPGDVAKGDPVLIDDGRVRLRVEEVDGEDVHTQVLVGGPVSDHKGINLPGVAVSVPALSEKDVDDLRFALHLCVDFVALSFVRSAADVEDVRRVMDEEGIHVPVIAKIEKPQAIDNIDGIVDAFDGLMVARGDLGVECPLEDVPFLQKDIIRRARTMAKPVIVATQMLDSMISSPAPTRAEASDVANAVLDGADAVMLSGETSVGDYPVATVDTMARIVESTEDHGLQHMAAIPWDPHTRSGVITKAAAEVAERVGARYLVAFTQSGDSARRIARLRQPVPVLAFTPLGSTRSQLSVVWGVETFKTAPVEHTDEMVRQVDEALLAAGRVEQGDLVVIIAGQPARHPRLHQRAAHPPDGRRHQRGRAGLPALTPGASRGPGAPGGTRTHTGRGLSTLPLPIGIPGPGGDTVLQRAAPSGTGHGAGRRGFGRGLRTGCHVLTAWSVAPDRLPWSPEEVVAWALGTGATGTAAAVVRDLVHQWSRTSHAHALGNARRAATRAAEDTLARVEVESWLREHERHRHEPGAPAARAGQPHVPAPRRRR